MSVPVTNKIRQRQESASSVGSWQLISGTGSLRSADSNSIEKQQNNIAPNCNSYILATPNANQISQESSCTLIDDDCFTSNFINDSNFM